MFTVLESIAVTAYMVIDLFLLRGLWCLLTHCFKRVTLTIHFTFILSVPSLLIRIVHHMVRNSCRRVIVVYPNSGEQWDAHQSAWKEGTGCTSPDEFADRMVEAIRLVRKTWESLLPESAPPRMIVGGCCRTSPTTIAAIRQRLDALELAEKM